VKNIKFGSYLTLLDPFYIRKDGENSPTSDIDWGAYRITNLSNPSSDQDAATKYYVDQAITGENWWDRTESDTTLRPHYPNDDINIGLGSYYGDGSYLTGVLHSFTEQDPLSLHCNQATPQAIINVGTLPITGAIYTGPADPTGTPTAAFDLGGSSYSADGHSHQYRIHPYLLAPDGVTRVFAANYIETATIYDPLAAGMYLTFGGYPTAEYDAGYGYASIEAYYYLYAKDSNGIWAYYGDSYGIYDDGSSGNFRVSMSWADVSATNYRVYRYDYNSGTYTYIETDGVTFSATDNNDWTPTGDGQPTPNAYSVGPITWPAVTGVDGYVVLKEDASYSGPYFSDLQGWDVSTNSLTDSYDFGTVTDPSLTSFYVAPKIVLGAGTDNGSNLQVYGGPLAPVQWSHSTGYLADYKVAAGDNAAFMYLFNNDYADPGTGAVHGAVFGVQTGTNLGRGQYADVVQLQSYAYHLPFELDGSFLALNGNSGGRVGIGTVTDDGVNKLRVEGTTLLTDKLKFTQTDGNEYIDSLNDNFMDYGATTAHRFNTGKVGIGSYKTAPAYALDVGGTAATDLSNSDNGFRTLTVTPPVFAAANLTLTAGGSNLDASAKYYYQMTYYTNIGETDATPSTLVATVTTEAAGGKRKVTITVPTSTDPRVIGRKIYRTEGGGSGYVYGLLVTIADNTTTTYVDDKTDASLGATNSYFRNNTTSQFMKNGTVTVMAPGTNTTRFGYNAGSDSATGGRNVFVGQSCGFNVLTGSDNVIVGGGAAYLSNPGSSVLMGQYAMGAMQGNQTAIVAIGYQAGFGSFGVARALNYSVVIGNQAGLGAYTQYSTLIGYQSGYGYNGAAANYNTHVGHKTGAQATATGTGASNTSIGNLSHTGLTSGGYNLALGSNAGRYSTTESGEFFVNSYDLGTRALEITDSLMYGEMKDNSPSTQTLRINAITSVFGNLGVGIATPTGYSTRKLHINDETGTYAGLHLTHTGSGTTADDGFDLGLNGATVYFVNREGGNYNFSPKADTDITFTFEGTTNSGVMKWMEDEDYFQFSDDVRFIGGENIVLDTTTGTKIGTATDQKLGFWNATPVVQQVFATGASHTVDELITVLQTLGLVKQS
jgi:hypothetical protein